MWLAIAAIIAVLLIILLYSAASTPRNRYYD
jgi:hypothetical protein